MDKTGLGFIILAVLVVACIFWFAGVDQTQMATAELRTEITLDRAPAIEEAAVDFGMLITTRALGAAVVSLVIIAATFLYQQARIRELKHGGWDRFWDRRKPPQAPRQKAERLPSFEKLLTVLLMRDMNRKN